MVVKVDLAGLRRAPRRTEGGGFFVAFVPSRANTADPSAVAQAVLSGNALFEPGEDQVLVAGPAQMPAGLVAFVSEVDSPTVWDAGLQEVTTGWSRPAGTAESARHATTTRPTTDRANEVDATGAGIVLPVDDDRFAAEAAAARAGRGLLSRAGSSPPRSPSSHALPRSTTSSTVPGSST